MKCCCTGRRDSHRDRRDDGRKRRSRSRSRSPERRSSSSRGRDHDKERDRDRDRDRERRDRGRGRRDRDRERTPEKDRRRKRDEDRKTRSPEKKRRREHGRRSRSPSYSSGSELGAPPGAPPSGVRQGSREPAAPADYVADTLVIKEEKDGGYPTQPFQPITFGRDPPEEVDLDYGHEFDKDVFHREEPSAMEKEAVSSSNSPVMGYRRSLADSTTIDADLVRTFVLPSIFQSC